MKISNLLIVVLFSLSSLCAQVIRISSMAQLDSILATKDSRVIVKFYKKSCPPCTSFSPIYEDASKDPQWSNILFVEVDALANPDISQRFNIRSLPTIKFFRNGQPVKSETGFKSLNQFRSLISSSFSL